MKRNLTLLSLAAIVFILLGVWLYLLFFSSTANSDQEQIESSGEFVDFGFGDSSDPNQSENDNTVSNDASNNPTQPVAQNALRQLTTRNVIGYSEILNGTGVEVYFMESGVGHVYSVDVSSGEERRISATTIPDARSASFASDGSFVVVKTGNDAGNNSIYFVELDTDTNTALVPSNPLAEMASDYTVTQDNEVLFATVGNSNVAVQKYDPMTTDTTTLFNTPFREAKILFGSSSSASHYFYPKTSTSLEGFMYEFVSDSIERLPIAGFGLSAISKSGAILYTARSGSIATSALYDTTSGNEVSVTPILPEKCNLHKNDILCATDGNTLSFNSIDKWNKGSTQYVDSLWSMGGNDELLVDISTNSGRFVDVQNGLISESTDYWYFQNKLDNSLWVFELSRNNEQ